MYAAIGGEVVWVTMRGLSVYCVVSCNVAVEQVTGLRRIVLVYAVLCCLLY